VRNAYQEFRIQNKTPVHGEQPAANHQRADSAFCIQAVSGQALDIGKRYGVTRDLSGGPEQRELEPGDELAAVFRPVSTSGLTVQERARFKGE
jgi:hypothetical protein